MLYLETLSPENLGLLRRIQSQPAFRDTRLVGGSALALHLGHRTSMDFDLFGNWEEQPPLEPVLSRCAKSVVREGSSERLQFFTVDGVKVDCVTYEYPWLEPAVVSDGVRIASLKDIAAMKLSAITNRGTRKDFVDLYFLLGIFPLKDMLGFYHLKYADANLLLVLRSLVYFVDAETTPLPRMLKPLDWAYAKAAIRDAVRKL